MKKIFEHRRLLFADPILERVTIEGENILSEMVDLRNDKVFRSWDSTLREMGHKSEKSLIDILKGYRYQEVGV
jgi:hypothetical protein